MNQTEKNNVERLLIKMDQLGLKPSNPIIINNRRQLYCVVFNGKTHWASYIVSRNLMGENGPALICCFGFLNEKTQHFFSSIAE